MLKGEKSILHFTQTYNDSHNRIKFFKTMQLTGYNLIGTLTVIDQLLIFGEVDFAFPIVECELR